MNHSQILKRAWSILWSYRALWVFGFLLALTTPSPSNPDDKVRYELDERDVSRWNLPSEFRRGLRELRELLDFTWTPIETQTVITWIIVAVVGLLVLSVVFVFVHYVSKVALIKMVDTYERSGEKVGWRQGFKLGWSKEAWRLFLVNLAVYLPVTLVGILLFGCAILPVFLVESSGILPTWTGVIATIGLVFVLIFFFLLLALLLSLIMEIIYRMVVLQGTGVGEGIRLGWQMVRLHIKDVFILWLILVGIQIGFLAVLLPLMVLFIGMGLLIGGGAGLGVYALAQSLWSTTAGWVSGVLVGLTLLLLVVGLPLLFVSGLKETYLSTTWTLAFRTLSLPAVPATPAELDAPAS
jgi:hypothetical protein